MPESSLSYREVARAWVDHMKASPCYAAHVWRAESFRASVGEPMTMRHAKALNAVLARCTLFLVPGELLVGIGNLGRSAPAGTYDEATRQAAKETCLGKEIRRRTFATHADHHAPDYPELLRRGFGGLQEKVRQALPSSDAKGRIFLDSVLLALEGASAHMRRWAAHCETLAAGHTAFGALLREQSERVRRLAEEPPRSFADALQLVLSYHYMMQLDDRYAMAFGRLDQFLFPFYAADRAAGRLSADAAQVYLDHFFAKITVDGDVQNIALGGVRPVDGADATNELSYMILEACKRVGQAGGNCTARIHKNSPPAFVEKCAEVIRTGIGYPAVVNDEVAIPALLDSGYPLPDARDYCFVGCIETFIPGKQAPWADGRANSPYSLNLAIFRGEDSLTGARHGPETAEPATFEEFYQTFLGYLKRHVDELVAAANAVQQPAEDRADEFTSPLMSALVQDCIARGRDLNDGGAIHPANNGFAGMGLASVADSLAALKTFVFEQKRFTMNELRTMLRADFEGYEAERQLLLRGAPKFGNDDDAVDALAVRFAQDYAAMFRAHRNPQGGLYWLLLGSNVSNIPAGAVIGATPDGRKAKTPISDAASPYFGRDHDGPTAAVRSIGKIPFRLCAGGNVVNMKFHAGSLQGEGGKKALAALIRTCFDLGGWELQFNTTDRAVLERAMARPEEYEDLVVRVSGFSFRYTQLSRVVQQDILRRTEHAFG